jgi:hypothetical protein
MLTLSLVSGFVTLKMEATRSSETSVLTRSIQRNIPEEGILEQISGLGPNMADFKL